MPVPESPGNSQLYAPSVSQSKTGIQVSRFPFTCDTTGRVSKPGAKRAFPDSDAESSLHGLQRIEQGCNASSYKVLVATNEARLHCSLLLLECIDADNATYLSHRSTTVSN